MFARPLGRASSLGWHAAAPVTVVDHSLSRQNRRPEGLVPAVDDRRVGGVEVGLRVVVERGGSAATHAVPNRLVGRPGVDARVGAVHHAGSVGTPPLSREEPECARQGLFNHISTPTCQTPVEKLASGFYRSDKLLAAFNEIFELPKTGGSWGK